MAGHDFAFLGRQHRFPIDTECRITLVPKTYPDTNRLPQLCSLPNLIRVDFKRAIGNIVPGVFTPVLAKHSKSFSLIDCISVGVDRMQRNFEPMRKPGSSLVEIDLEPRNGGTLVRLRHSGLPDWLERIHGERWSHHLTRLEEVVLESVAKPKANL
jgi:hypothetical protein